MAQDDELTPATREDLITTLSFALQFTGRKRTHHADSFMARIAAEHLVDHLDRSGFVVSKRPPAGNLSHLAVYTPRPKE